MFRPDGEPLLPNWRHLPVGYHGRAGHGRASRARRSSARTASARSERPAFGPTQRLDIELELGFVTGAGSRSGTPIADRRRPRPRLRLRARQRLERARHPALGVPAARPVPGQVVRDLDLALGRPAGRAASRTASPAPPQDPEPLAYLRTTGDWALDIALEVELNGEVIIPHERPRAVLDVPAAARPRDRQRRRRAARATCSPPARSPAPSPGSEGSLIELGRAVPAGRRHGRAARHRRRARLVRRGRRHHRAVKRFPPPGGGPLTVTGVTGAHRFGVLVLNIGAFGH